MRRFKSSLKGMYFSFLFSSKDERFILVEHFNYGNKLLSAGKINH